MKQAIQIRCPGVYTYRVSMKKAIESEVLPEPTVYLMPLFLNTTRMAETIIKNPRGKTTKEVTYDGRWEATRNKHIKYIIHCTQSQKHEHLCSMVEWYKKQYMTTRNEGLKHLWLRASLDRLQWLSNIKVKYSIDINNMCINKKIRSLVFCSSIDQSNLFPKTHPINSKNSVKDNQVYLDNFNKGVINNVTAVNSLNEGVNLVNCQVGVFNTINSSEIMTIQKIGRILRHPNPILIIPYFSSTREEELVDKMLEHYNKDNVKKIMNISQIKL
jgi:superfamily II DNA or RNA helicase